METHRMTYYQRRAMETLAKEEELEAIAKGKEIVENHQRENEKMEMLRKKVIMEIERARLQNLQEMEKEFDEKAKSFRLMIGSIRSSVVKDIIRRPSSLQDKVNCLELKVQQVMLQRRDLKNIEICAMEIGQQYPDRENRYNQGTALALYDEWDMLYKFLINLEASLKEGIDIQKRNKRHNKNKCAII